MKTIGKWLRILFLVGGVLPASRVIIDKFVEVHQNEKLVREVVLSSASALPHVMDGGLIRCDKVTGDAGILTWHHTFLTYSEDEIDKAKMTQILRDRALSRIDQGKNLSQLVLQHVPVAYRYADKNGNECIAFEISRDDLISFRQWQRREASNKPTGGDVQ